MMIEHESADILANACKQIGLNSSGAIPIRLAENALWRLPGGVVVRIARKGNIDISKKEIKVARWLKDQGISAVVPLTLEQPLEFEGRPVTFWEELAPHREGTPLEVSKVLKRLHSLAPPDFLPKLKPLAGVETRITQASWLPTADREWMLELYCTLKTRWDHLPPRLPECVVHGDAWGGNCVVDDNGCTHLLDFERVAIGPPEWDLVSTAIELTDGWLSAESYATYCETYGSDVMTWDGFETLRAIRELRRTAWGAVVAESDPKWQQQVRFRIECLQGKHGPRPWKWTSIL